MFETRKEEIANEIVQVEHLDQEVHHVNNPVLDLPVIEKKYLKTVVSYHKAENSFVFDDGHSKVEVKIFTDDIIRVKLAPSGDFLDDFSYAIDPQNQHHHTHGYQLFEEPTQYLIQTANVICKIQKQDFLISFSTIEGTLLNTDAKPMHWEENPDFGGYYVYCTKEAMADEVFLGGGDKASHLNLRGRRIQNWNSDTYSFAFNQDPLYKTIPFYIGVTQSKAYGIFFDNTFRTYFDFAAEDKTKTSFWSEGGELQYYFINGPQIMDVVKKYHYLTGTHYLPPTWALGYHQSRWSYYPEKNVRDLAHGFRSRQIPCDAIYFDIDYMEGYRCFTWNKKYFPDPKKMISDLAANGFKTVLMIDPGIKVDPNYWVFKEGQENKFFCRRGDDYFMEGYVWPGRCQFPDFTNPKVREWWGTLYKDLIDDGAAGFWNDMNEPAVFGRGTFPDDVRHHYDGYRGSHRKAHNVYGMQMVRATYEGLKKLYKNKRPFTLTRAAYSGTQRYSSVWTGDNIATWEHLKMGILQLQRLSVSGLSFCGTDIGGFTGNPDGELFTRWMQFGTFSPYMRVHSAGDTRDREPWSFGPEWEVICKKFIELRYQLLPYIYTAFWQQHKFGMPILRPIALLEQHNFTNLLREDEFAFGDHILVSPIYKAGQTEKVVYLPEGNWYYYFNNETYQGGKENTIATPLDEMPMFVKAGAVIPEYPVMQYVDEIKIHELKLNVYFGEGEEHSTIYSDHGETFAYEQGVFIEKHFIQVSDSSTLSLHQHRSGLYDEKFNTYKMYFIGLPFEIQNIKIDGHLTQLQKDDKGNIFVTSDADFKKLTINL